MEPNQDPEAQNVQGLRLSQAQGLPLAGSLPLSGGLPLGAVPRLPLAPVQVQGQPTGTPERIGNILQSIAAGMQGQVAPWEQIQQAQQDRALRQQQLAQQQQLMEAQLPNIQAQTAMHAVDMFSKLATIIQGAPEDKKQEYADMFAPLMVNMHQTVTAGPQGIPAAPLDTEKAKSLLMTPGALQQWAKEQQDANPEDLKAVMRANMKIPEADAFLAKRRAERIAAVMPMLEQQVGGYIEKLRQEDPKTPVTQDKIEKGIEDFLKVTPEDAIAKQYGVTKSLAATIVSDWFSGPKSKEFLTRRGVAIGGKSTREMGIEGAADYIQKDPGFAALNIPIGDWEKIPSETRKTILERAKMAQQADASRTASMTGYAGAMATARAKMDEPLIVSNPSLMPVVVKSEQPLDRTKNSMAAVQKMGGESVVRFLNEKQWEAFGAAKEMETILGQYVQVAKALTDRPGANFGQAAKFYAQTFMGQDNPGVALAALEGSKLRMARALQGSAQSLSNLDVKTTDAMIPKATDTIQVALHKLEIAGTIVETMKKVQLGQAETGSLLGKVQQLQSEVNASKTPQVKPLLTPGQRIIEGPGGIRKVAPGAGKLPEGWTEVPK